jgi:hypothetical protein
MQMFVTRKTGSLLAATACGAALMVFAAVDPAAAQKGSNFKSTTTGTIKPPPSPRVRDHREVRDHRKTTSLPQGGVTVTEGRRPRKSTTVCYLLPCAPVGEPIRDHRKRPRDHR